MIENIIGKRYAKALSESIDSQTRIDEALKDLNELWDAFQKESQLGGFFANPAIPPENKKAMVNDLCERVDVEPEVRNLLITLVERRKILNLRNVAEYFQSAVDERLNRVRATVIVAVPLSESQVRQLKADLSEIMGKEILIEISVDESLLGGIVLRIGGLVADASIRNRLFSMKRFIAKEEVA